MPVTSLYNLNQNHHPGRGKSFDDSDPFLATNKPTGRARGVQENNLLKSFSVDKERANNVAKIKVVVCIYDHELKFSYSFPFCRFLTAK